MQLLNQTKGVKITLDMWFGAFRKLDRESLQRAELAGFVFTLANPVAGVWFVHAFTLDGRPVGSASFDRDDR